MARMTLKNAKKTASKRSPKDLKALKDLYGEHEAKDKLTDKALMRSIDDSDIDAYTDIVTQDYGRESITRRGRASSGSGR